jgi:hypothetical protein
VFDKLTAVPATFSNMKVREGTCHAPMRMKGMLTSRQSVAHAAPTRNDPPMQAARHPCSPMHASVNTSRHPAVPSSPDSDRSDCQKDSNMCLVVAMTQTAAYHAPHPSLFSGLKWQLHSSFSSLSPVLPVLPVRRSTRISLSRCCSRSAVHRS